MRRIILALIVLFLGAAGAFGQSTTVSGVVTDLGGQAWKNGTITFTFSGPGNSTWSGGTIPATVPATLDNTGAYTASVPDNNQIVPSPTFWNIRVCPQFGITAQCFVQSNVTVTGLTQTTNLAPPAIRIAGNSPLPVAAYADAEIVAPVLTGFIYDQLTAVGTGSYRQCDAVGSAGNCTTWNAVGSGGGGGSCPPGGASNGQLLYDNAGACGATAGITTDGANLTLEGNVYVGEVEATQALGGNLALTCDASVSSCVVQLGTNGANIQTQVTGSSLSVTTTSGSTFGSPTGGAEGSGTINVDTGYYLNGVLLGQCPGGASGDVQYSNGTNCASDSSLTHNSATLSTTVIGNGTSSLSTFAADANGLFGLMVDAGGGQVTLGANDIAGRTLDLESSGGTDINSSGTVSVNGSSGVSVQVGNASPVTPGSVTQRAVTGTTDTILNTDRGNRVAYNSTSAVAATLPQSGGVGFAGGFNTRLSNQNTGVVTVTSTSSTINGNATLVLQEGQDCFITPSSTGTNWAADCNEPQITAGTGITLTRGVHSLTISNSGPTGTVTSVSFTGGLISVANPTTTPAFTVAGTSGGIPYFSSASTWASSAALTANCLVKGGGAGASPSCSSISDNATTVSTSELVTFSGNGAASVSPLLLNGTLFTGGSGTTTFPYFYINQGTAPTTFSTSGTQLGLNAPSGFSGNFLDFHVNGAASVFSISSAGQVNTAAGVSSSNGTITGLSMQVANNTGGVLNFLNAGNHIDTQAASTDIAGTIAISSATSASKTFTAAYTHAPNCILTPQSDPTAVGVWWATTSTTAVTANVKVSGTISFTYICFAAIN
jgi:hypothetical protein